MPLSARQLTQVHRRQQLALRQSTMAEMRRLWPNLDWARLDATYPQFAGMVAEMVAKNRRTSSGLAAAYLRAYRVASGLDGDVRIVVPQVVNIEQLDAALHSTTVAAAKKSATQSVPAAVAMHNALTVASGAMSRLVLDAGRESVTRTIQSDGDALGWQRVLGGGGCDFCRMLAGRGDVYSKGTSTFEAHDHCGCTAEPVYTDEQRNAPSDWRPSGAAKVPELGFDSMSVDRVEQQVGITEALPDSEWRTKQLARLRKRLAELR